MPEADSTIARLQDQTAQNTQDIASLITSVTSLAHTVERHERMMVDGFNKMENALEKGLSAVTHQIDRDRAKVEDSKIPWWQLIGTLSAVITLFGGALVAFVLILHSSQSSEIDVLRNSQVYVQDQVIENRVRAEVNSALLEYRREEARRGPQ